jgi:serine/threonine protein kinase
LRELDILRRAKHANIVKLVEEYNTNEFAFLIFEYCKGGDLLELLRDESSNKLSESETCNIVYELTKAIAYIHSLSIVHRDVKLENVLIQKHLDSTRTIKLADFGLAVRVDENEKSLMDKCGTPSYVAPEILAGTGYGLQVDIWSLGVCFYMLMCGYAPFIGESDEQIFEAVKCGELKFADLDWAHVSAEARHLVQRMLDRNPQSRITAPDILKHDWFAKFS